jgi:tetratricopeptide repeat protein 30
VRPQDARLAHDNTAIKRAISEYDAALEAYIPGLMAAAAILWDQRAYSAVDRLLRQASEFASEHDAWKLNMGHNCFMQASRSPTPLLRWPIGTWVTCRCL